MTDRERLVELFKSAGKKFNDIDCTEEEALELLANHLLENGLIVPPFTIGQTVYAVDRESELYWKGTISSFCHCWEEWDFGVVFEDGDFSTCKKGDLFPTEEEALKALKGGAE